MIRKSTVLAALLFCAIYGSAIAAPLMMAFKISGGQTVKCPITDAGPIPAESGPYKMKVAGFLLHREPDGRNPTLTFTFGFEVQKTATLTHVTVEDVSDDKAVLLVDDTNPKVETAYWKGNAAAVGVSKKSTPWVFDKKPTIKIFRLTIDSRDNPEVILYQPAWYPAQSKAQIVQWATKND